MAARPSDRPTIDPDVNRSASLGERLGTSEPPTLPAGFGLTGLHAGRETLRALPDGDPARRWIDTESEGLALAGADLANATLSHAVLDGANLRGAVLSHAVGHSANLEHAILEAAKLDGADFGGSHFSSVQGGEADFSNAMLEDARFEHASLRYACFRGALLDAAVFTHADLWGSILEAVDADEADFRRARLDEAHLANGNFAQADFADASLKKADLTKARLTAVNFAGAKLDGAKLAGADLSSAGLPRVNLLSCDLTHVRLAGAWLELTRFQASQLGGATGEELAGEFEAARQAYIGLEQNFRALGNSEDASWAFRRRRIMGKKSAAARARQAMRDGAWWHALNHGTHWIADEFVEWLCDYGESLGRVMRAFVTTILTFAVGYGITGALTHAVADGRAVTRDPLDMLAYSFLNMLSTSAPDIGVKPVNEAVVILASLQGALGIVLIGLFGFVLGNRINR